MTDLVQGFLKTLVWEALNTSIKENGYTEMLGWTSERIARDLLEFEPNLAALQPDEETIIGLVTDWRMRLAVPKDDGTPRVDGILASYQLEDIAFTDRIGDIFLNRNLAEAYLLAAQFRSRAAGAEQRRILGILTTELSSEDLTRVRPLILG